jgi:hypothetical protein
MEIKFGKTGRATSSRIPLILSLISTLTSVVVMGLVAVFFSRSRDNHRDAPVGPAVRTGNDAGPAAREEPGEMRIDNRSLGERTEPGSPPTHDIGATLPTRDAETQPGGDISNAVERTGKRRIDEPVEPVEHREPVGKLLEENEQGPEAPAAGQDNQERFARHSVYAPEGTTAERAEWYRRNSTNERAGREASYQNAEENHARGYEKREHTPTTNWYAVAAGAAGLLLIAAPWIFSYVAYGVAFWTSIALGGAIVIMGVLEYLLGTRTIWERGIQNWAPYQSNWQYWTLFMLGFLTFCAPWVLVFVGTYQAFWVMVGVGLFIIVLAGSQVFSKRINYPTV